MKKLIGFVLDFCFWLLVVSLVLNTGALLHTVFTAYKVGPTKQCPAPTTKPARPAVQPLFV